jgi:hypothetical protein
LRERLLVRRGDRPARIADYPGRGALARWLRVTAVRVALNAGPSPDRAHRIDEAATLDHLAIFVALTSPGVWLRHQGCGPC